MYGLGGCSGNGGQVSVTPLSGLLILLTMLFQQLTVREEGLVGQLGLILLPDPIPSLMVLHSML